MGFGFSKARMSPIAIDFGADSLKLLQVTEDDPPQLVAAASAVVPGDVRGDAKARHEFYTDALRALVRDNGFRGKRVICAIPAYQTLVQHLTVTKSEGKDLEEQVSQHLRQRLNINASRMVTRAHMVPGLVRDGNKGEVICLAANRDVVLRHIEAVNKCKFDVVGMHCEPMMILKAFEHLFRRATDDKRTTCFIDIGAATTKVIIAHGKEMVFAKTIHAAGDHLIREHAETSGEDFDTARASRFTQPADTSDSTDSGPGLDRFGAPQRAATAVSAAGGERRQAAQPAPAAPAVLESKEHAEADVVDCLIDEIQLCVRYHQSAFPDRPIDRLVFVGGEARQVACCQRVAQALRIGAQLGDPLARLTRNGTPDPSLGIDLSETQPGWAVPIGLCLSEANL